MPGVTTTRAPAVPRKVSYNSAGNRWYSVRYTGEYEVYRGMMYCANLTAGC
ncbi:hypothetical protein AB0J82_10520 [Asanoa sp. NPDC049518]|uniref:hypothetical protein n=1 Tax=unclassified Asanoa TaxID=2685164 RepID=UPI0034367C25